MTTAKPPVPEFEGDVYQRLVQKVFSGQYRPGTRLIERELAEELGVSRVPVREALAHMVGQGALDGGRRQRSARVRQYTADEIHQLFEFREFIEGGAARVAAVRASAEDLARLKQICHAMDAEVGQRGFGEAWVNLEHQFHDAVAEASGNQWVAGALHLLLQQSHYVFYRLRWRILSELTDDEVRQVRMHAIEAHRAVLGHLRAHDPDGAEQAMRRHIRESYEGDCWPERVAADATPAAP